MYIPTMYIFLHGSVLGKKTKKIVDNSLWQASMVTDA